MYILDFDRTLFDVERLYLELAKINQSHLAGTEESFSLFSFKDLLFSDVKEFILNKRVVILSSSNGINKDWETEYQNKKIAETGLDKLVEEVVVMSGDKGVHARQIAEQFGAHEPVVFIDDRIENCLSVKRNLPESHCFLMARDPEVVGNNKQIMGIKVVNTLLEVDDIIKEL